MELFKKGPDKMFFAGGVNHQVLAKSGNGHGENESERQQDDN